MTLQQLRYVVAVEDLGSFTLAADLCCVTQPTLSQQVAKLEHELGVVLLDRSVKPVRATRAGREILREARRSYASMARIDGLIKEESGRQDGEVSLGIIPTLAPYVVAGVVAGLRQRFPALGVRVAEMLTEGVIEGLRKGNLDFGLCALPIPGEGVEVRELWDDPFVAYLPEGHPLLAKTALVPGDLDRRELLVLAEGHCFRDQVTVLCPLPEGGEGLRFEAGSFATLCSLVDAGLGVTFLPGLAVAGLGVRARERVRPFAAPAPSRRVVLATQVGYPRRTVLEGLVGVLAASCGAGDDWGAC